VVDTSKAGSGALSVTVDGPSKVHLDCDEVRPGYQFTYRPTCPGVYIVSIKYGGDVQIPGSPFHVNVKGCTLYSPLKYCRTVTEFLPDRQQQLM